METSTKVKTRQDNCPSNGTSASSAGNTVQVPPETDEPIGGGSGGVVEQDPPKTETPTDQSGTGQNGNQQTPSDSNAGNTSTS